MTQGASDSPPDVQFHAQEPSPSQTWPNAELEAGVMPDEVVLNQPVDPSAMADIEQTLAQTREQLANVQDQYMRALADADNLRRRASEDVAKAHKFAIESFAEALVPVKDSLETALALPDQNLATLQEGVQATLRQLTTAFEKGRLIEINPVGEKFDPHRHQAVSMVPGASQEPAVAANHVVAVMQKGYLIADRVLRPALVVVAQ